MCCSHQQLEQHIKLDWIGITTCAIPAGTDDARQFAGIAKPVIHRVAEDTIDVLAVQLKKYEPYTDGGVSHLYKQLLTCAIGDELNLGNEVLTAHCVARGNSVTVDAQTCAHATCSAQGFSSLPPPYPFHSTPPLPSILTILIYKQQTRVALGNQPAVEQEGEDKFIPFTCHSLRKMGSVVGMQAQQDCLLRVTDAAAFT